MTVPESPRWLLIRSQRGLSGTVISNRPKASAGTASMPSIHCQSWGIPTIQ